MIDFSKLTPTADLVGEDADDQRLLEDMATEAESFLADHDWCDQILESYASDIAVGGIVLVLLLKIKPASDEIDEWLWTVVGDLPPAYLVTDDAPNGAAALDAYVIEMRKWVEAVRNGKPVDDLIPVLTQGGSHPVEPTAAMADSLDRRLTFLEDEILRYDSDDLIG